MLLSSGSEATMVPCLISNKLETKAELEIDTFKGYY